MGGHSGLTHDVESGVQATAAVNAAKYMKEHEYIASARATISTPDKQGVSDDGSHTEDFHSFDLKAIVTGKGPKVKNETRVNDFTDSVEREKILKFKPPKKAVFSSTATVTSTMDTIIEEGPTNELLNSDVEADRITFNHDGSKYYKWRVTSHNHDETAHYPSDEDE